MITIDFRDSRPIYEQVRDSLRRLIVSGALPADEKLPSVRELAARLVINPNTIQRAYRELEREGYIVLRAGQGQLCEAARGRGFREGEGAAAHIRRRGGGAHVSGIDGLGLEIEAGRKGGEGG